MFFDEFKERTGVKCEKKGYKARSLGYPIFHFIVGRRNPINRNILLSIGKIRFEPRQRSFGDAEK